MKPMMGPFVSIVVVNYNGQSLLRKCLNSLRQQTYRCDQFEVIVVDNASTDTSVNMLRGEFPWARTMVLSSNIGFAGGNNAGFDAARGEWIGLLNSDAVAEPGWIVESVAAGVADPAIGGVAAQLVFANAPHIVNSTGLQLYQDGRAGDRDFQQSVTDNSRPAGEVFGGCGAALLLRRAMIDQIRGFDSRLFMYYEDLDLAWRARKAGWRFVYAPSAKAQHAFGGSVGVASPLQLRFVERNRVIVNLMHAPIWLAIATAMGLVVRVARSAWRSLFDSNVTSLHVLGLCKALMETAIQLPRIVIDRLPRDGGDQVFRQWSRPLPR